MKKYQIMLTAIVTATLVACTQSEKVNIVKETTDITAVQPYKAEEKAVPLINNLPPNVTAICRDGTYSTAKDETVCIGNGGVSNAILRYQAE
ncbi:hypothetical protein A4G19_07600 [Pasteurellaceae bacterium Macca]|nr:hypothetical protein [Pasteurellaceae bacterium Macca]